ncbi:MAG: sulfotransferase [Planctomycetia bacterium]|nr:sulfotransferase [Planctomycetia bacterium]
MAATAQQARRKKKPSGAVDRWYHPRIWHGFLFTAWLRLLWRNQFRVGWHRVAAAAIITFLSAGHSLGRVLQWIVYGRRIARTKIEQPPLFILGHWRSGTTMLHEMLALDPQNTCPTTYQCFVPNHFLISEWICTRLFAWVMPKQRPMDNMAVGWNRPQEDEFALMAMGEPSPYFTIAFPNHPPQCQEYLDMQGVPPVAQERWQRTLRRFVQMLVCHRPGRAILKSPTHTGRVRTLLEAFPDARFIHIVRDPRVLYQSTLNMWKKMYGTHGLQRARFAGLEEHVLATLPRMYAAFESARASIPPRHYYEVRYEDLVADPLGQMRAMYQQLELGDFEAVLPALERYLSDQADYQTNRYEMPEELREKINQRWADYARRFGY